MTAYCHKHCVCDSDVRNVEEAIPLLASWKKRITPKSCWRASQLLKLFPNKRLSVYLKWYLSSIRLFAGPPSRRTDRKLWNVMIAIWESVFYYLGRYINTASYTRLHNYVLWDDCSAMSGLLDLNLPIYQVCTISATTGRFSPMNLPKQRSTSYASVCKIRISRLFLEMCDWLPDMVW